MNDATSGPMPASLSMNETELHAKVCALTGTDMLVLIEEIRLAEVRYRKLAALVQQYEQQRKHVLSTLMLQHREQMKSNQQAEHAAYADPQYLQFLAKTRKAAERVAEAEADYWRLRNQLDVAKALLSYHQTELRTLP